MKNFHIFFCQLRIDVFKNSSEVYSKIQHHNNVINVNVSILLRFHVNYFQLMKLCIQIRKGIEGSIRYVTLNKSEAADTS